MEEIINELIKLYNAEIVENIEEIKDDRYYILREKNFYIFLKYITLENTEYNYYFLIKEIDENYIVKSEFVYEEFEEQFTNIKDVLKYIKEQLKLESFSKNAFKYLQRIIDGNIIGETFVFKRNMENILKYKNYNNLPLFKLYIQEDNKDDTITLTPSDEFKKAYGNK